MSDPGSRVASDDLAAKRAEKAGEFAGEVMDEIWQQNDEMADRALCMAWHDHICPEGTDCRSRELHAAPANYLAILPALRAVAIAGRDVIVR